MLHGKVKHVVLYEQVRLDYLQIFYTRIASVTRLAEKVSSRSSGVVIGKKENISSKFISSKIKKQKTKKKVAADRQESRSSLEGEEERLLRRWGKGGQ